MEANQNKLNFSSLNYALWYRLFGPDAIALDLTTLNNTTEPAYSLPIAVHGQRAITFQGVLTLPEGSERQIAVKLAFQSSLNGRNWDNIPGARFTPDISSVTIESFPLTKRSYTYELAIRTNYVRVVVTNEGEGGFEAGETLTVYTTDSEA